MPRKAFMDRVAYLKAEGFIYRKSDNIWTKKGDHVDRVQLELDNLENIQAAKQAAPKQEPKQEQGQKEKKSVNMTIEDIVKIPAAMQQLCDWIAHNATDECLEIMFHAAFNALSQGYGKENAKSA